MDAAPDCLAYASDLKVRRRSAFPCDANGNLLRWMAGGKRSRYRRVAPGERNEAEDSASDRFIFANANTRGLLQVNKLRHNAPAGRLPGTDQYSSGGAWAGGGRLMRSRQRARSGVGRGAGRDTEAQASAASRRNVSGDTPAADAAQRNAASSAGPMAGSTSTSKGSWLFTAQS